MESDQRLPAVRLSCSEPPVPHAEAIPYVFTGFTSEHSFAVPKVSPWSAESPARYRVDVELLSPAGVVPANAEGGRLL